MKLAEEMSFLWRNSGDYTRSGRFSPCTMWRMRSWNTVESERGGTVE